MARRAATATATTTATVGKRPASGTATAEFTPAVSIPNKPMVPTAPNQPEERSPDTWRRHIGQPLDSLESGERRPASEQNSGRVQRTTGCGQRTTGCGQRTTSIAQRAAINGR